MNKKRTIIEIIIFFSFIIVIVYLLKMQDLSNKKMEQSNTELDKILSQYSVNENESFISNEHIKENNMTVYITPTGKRYHIVETCGGKNSYATTLDKAKNFYYLTPCKKCAR